MGMYLKCYCSSFQELVSARYVRLEFYKMFVNRNDIKFLGAAAAFPNTFNKVCSLRYTEQYSTVTCAIQYRVVQSVHFDTVYISAVLAIQIYRSIKQ